MPNDKPPEELRLTFEELDRAVERTTLLKDARGAADAQLAKDWAWFQLEIDQIHADYEFNRHRDDWVHLPSAQYFALQDVAWAKAEEYKMQLDALGPVLDQAREAMVSLIGSWEEDSLTKYDFYALNDAIARIDALRGPVNESNQDR